MVVEPHADRIVAAVTARTRLIAISHVLWTTGAVLPVHELKDCDRPPDPVGTAPSRPASIPVDATGLGLLHDLRAEVAVRAGGDGRARRRVIRRPARSGSAQLPLSGRTTFDGDVRCWKDGAARFDPNVTPTAAVAGLARPPIRFPSGPSSAHEMAERFRARLTEAGRDVVVPSSAEPRSWRVPADESADVVSRLAEAGVIVRDLPGRGLVRASVGWWTSEGDLERLVQAL